ncbi:MAG: DedA family protein [Gemmataceae bacterium]
MPVSDLIYELVSWFAFLASAGLGNPIPEEVMIAMAGIRTAHLAEIGPVRWLILPVCMAGAVMADVLLYALGRFFGGRLMRTALFARLAPEAKQAQIRHNFHRYGVMIFVIGRLVPGIRTTLFLTAGTMRLALVRFLVADGLGAVFGTTLFFLLGYGLGSQFRDLLLHLEEQIAPYKPVGLLLLLGAVTGYLLYVFLRHPIPTGDPEEVPLIGHQIAAHMPQSTDDEEDIEGSARRCCRWYIGRRTVGRRDSRQHRDRAVRPGRRSGNRDQVGSAGGAAGRCRTTSGTGGRSAVRRIGGSGSGSKLLALNRHRAGPPAPAGSGCRGWRARAPDGAANDDLFPHLATQDQHASTSMSKHDRADPSRRLAAEQGTTSCRG